MAARYDPDKAREALEEWLVRDEGDETRALCPLCEDVGASNSPSASFNFANDKWNCLKTDADGGSISRLIKVLAEREDGTNVRPIRPNVTAPADKKSPPSEDDVEAWHNYLMSQTELLEQIEEVRGWSVDTLSHFIIGHHRSRFTIPIYDEHDQLVNVRQYKLNPGDGQQKFINLTGYGKNRLWGFETLRDNDWVLLCAGEPDRILAIQEGFPAVTWTGGEGNFQPEWATHFENKIVKVCLDADDTGRKGAEKVVEILRAHAAEVWVVTLPEKVKGYDVTDVLLQEGPKALQGYIDAAELVETTDENPITETDHGNALRLVDAHADDFRHVADMMRWHVWDGTRWALDIGDRAIRRAHINLAHQLPPGGFKRNSLSAGGIASAVRVAQVDRRISIEAEQLDAWADLLNTPREVVNLRTGDSQQFDPSLLMTRRTAYPADLDGKHPRWDRFLEETFAGSESLIPYLQRLAGLALVGSVPYHILPFLHGVGRNGKGVITLVLQGLLGNADSGGYAVSAPDGFLLTGRDSAHPTELARLRGARLVVASEQSSTRKFDEIRVKKYTGGDRLAGRFMHGNFFEFNPTHLMWVMSNRLPAVREGGPAFWERVRLIPFQNVVPKERRISDLDRILLDAEGPAILGWAVRGAVEVLKNGLQDPQEVIAATEDYKISEDTLASFVRDECQMGPDLVCRVPEFNTRYRQHCEEMDAEPDSTKSVTMRLTSEYGILAGRNGSSRLYKGVTLSEKLSMSGHK